MNIVGERRIRSWLPMLVACLSLAFGVLGVTWLLDAGSCPFGTTPEGYQLSLLAYLPERVSAGTVAVLGLLGVPAAVGHARTAWSPSAYRPLLWFTGLQVVLFGLLAPNITVVVLSGYLLVLVGLPLAAGWLALGAWRQPATRLVLLAIVLVIAGLEVSTGLFDWSGIGAETLDAQPGIRVFGLGLGLVAIASSVATLGLVRPWGETWPRWIPYVAGRPVPIKAVLIPGTAAAALLLVGSTSLMQLTWSPHASTLANVGHLLWLPFPLWGASVGLATAAYYYRRRAQCAECLQHQLV